MTSRSPDRSDAAPHKPEPATGTDDDLGSLPGRWQLIAVVTFFAFVAAVFGIPWLLGHYWLWEHARLIGPLLGVGFTVGTRRWWFAKAGLLDEHGQRIVTPAAPTEVPATAPAVDTLAAPDGAHARLRRSAGWALVRWWGTWFALLLCILAIVIGNRTVNDVNTMIDSQPHQKLPVVAVNRHTLGNDGPDITVDVPGYGEVDVTYSDYVRPVPHVGDTIDVVVDPDDPTDVVPVAYRHSSDNSPLMGVLICAGLMGITAYLGWWTAPASRRAARAVRRSSRLETVIVQARAGEEVSLLTQDGSRLLWHDEETRTSRRPPVGAVLPAAGELAPGGSAALLHEGRVLWTGKLKLGA